MPRLPVANRQEILEELAIIDHERRYLEAGGRIVSQENYDNTMASLKDWEDDLRQQLAEMPAKACGFCKGGPVGDAATWLDGKPRPPAPCPRCGETYTAPVAGEATA